MRLIDGDALIKAIILASNKTYNAITQYRTELTMDYLHGLDDAIQIIKDAPSADRWIPCEERLPSEQGQYLVTFPLCNGEPWVYILSFSKGKFYEADDEWGDVEYDDVTAWMPLPEPWRGADDE